MNTLTVTIPKPHKTQEEFLRGRKRFNILKCGRRWGKTSVCQILISEIIKRGGKCGYWSPTYKDLSEVWKETKSIFAEIITRKDEQLKELEFIGGARLDFWSMDDPNSGRGRKYHRAIMDECEKAPKFQEAWEQAIAPTLTDFGGDGYFLSTPKFGETYFKAMAQNVTRFPKTWGRWVYTTYDNPHIPREEIEAMRELLHPAVFDCEYMAMDVDGKVLNPFAFQFQDCHINSRAVFLPAKPLIISIDFNLEPFAVTFGHFWRDQNGYHDWTFDEAEIPQGSIPAMIDLIKSRYGRYLFACEITGDFMGRRGDISQRDNASLYTQLVRGLGVSERHLKLPKEGNPTHENSKADVNYVLFKAFKGECDISIHPSCKGLIRDLRGVQWDNLKGGIKKRDRNIEEQRADLLDTWRYKVNVYWRDFIKRGN